MADWQKLIENNGGSRPEAYEARIAQDAIDEQTLIEVIIPAFSATQTWGPCPWMPRGDTLPVEGDRALVVLGSTEDPGTPEIWISAWWPI